MNLEPLEAALVQFFKTIPSKDYMSEKVLVAYESVYARLQELKLKETKNG